MENRVNYEIKNIKIYDIPGFFIHERIRRILMLYDITTLEDFFYAIDNSCLVTVLESSSIILKELLATYKLLRCKYLGETPNIIINDSMSQEEIIDALGLSFETGEELMKLKRPKDFFCKLSKKTLGQKKILLRKITQLSEQSIEELVYRLQIINDYDKLISLNRQKEEKNVAMASKNNGKKHNSKAMGNSVSRKKKVENEEERDARLKAAVNLLPRAKVVTTETEEERLARLGALVGSLPAFRRR